jgi:hypothetical protein
MRYLTVYAALFLMFLGLSSCVPPEEMITPTLPPPTVTPTRTPTPIFLHYTVRQGDTLGEIAQQYNIDVELLAEVNELEDVNAIRIGDDLLISDYVTISGRVLPTPTPTPTPTATPRPCLHGCVNPLPGCDIKGVTSRIDGIRIYVLPDDDFYPIRDAELWFCDEKDAVRDGWRHWTEWGPAEK